MDIQNFIKDHGEPPTEKILKIMHMAEEMHMVDDPIMALGIITIVEGIWERLHEKYPSIISNARDENIPLLTMLVPPVYKIMAVSYAYGVLNTQEAAEASKAVIDKASSKDAT